MHRRAPWRSKQEECHPIVSDVNYPGASLLEFTWLRDAHAHKGGPPDKPNMDSEPGKVNWLVRGNLEETPYTYIYDWNCHKGAPLSQWTHVSIYMYSFSS